MGSCLTKKNRRLSSSQVQIEIMSPKAYEESHQLQPPTTSSTKSFSPRNKKSRIIRESRRCLSEFSLVLNDEIIKRSKTIIRTHHSETPKRVLSENFWESMPIDVVKARISDFRDDITRSRGDFKQSIDFIIETLSKIRKNFGVKKYKRIKISSSKFHKFVGSYLHGILVMKALGFREVENHLKLNDGLSVNYIRNKIEEINEICKSF